MKRERYIILLLSGLLMPAVSWGLSVDEIISRADSAAYYRGDDGKAHVQMTIIDRNGRKRERKFTILRSDDDKGDNVNGDQRFFVYFTRPADVNKTSFLVWKHTRGDDDRWLYLPALDLVKRIAAGDKRTSFVGSHFFYEDVSGRNPKEDRHELEKESSDYYVIKSTPISKHGVEFSYYRTWIHSKSFIPVKAEYYDESGKVYRTYEALKVETVDGYPTVTEARMSDRKMGGSTSLKYSGVKYNIGLNDDIFTERYLRNPPRKLLR